MGGNGVSCLSKKGEDGVCTQNCAVPRGKVPKILQGRIRYSERAFETPCLMACRISYGSTEGLIFV